MPESVTGRGLNRAANIPLAAVAGFFIPATSAKHADGSLARAHRKGMMILNYYA